MRSASTFRHAPHQAPAKGVPILALLAVIVALSMGGCARQPVRVVTPLRHPLEEADLTLVVTAEPSILGFVSPNERSAKWLRRRISNRLIQEGFVLRPEEADVHVWIHLDSITTGGTNGESKCELSVRGYEESPGDLQSEKARATVSTPELFRWDVEVVRRQLRNGVSREQLVRDTEEACAETVVERLVRSR